MHGQNVDDLVKYQMDTFGYSEDVAREEVVANSAAAVLTDEEFVRNLYNNEHSLFEQIRKFFKELAETFKQLTQSASWSQDAALTPENVRHRRGVRQGGGGYGCHWLYHREADAFQKGVLRYNSCNQRRVFTARSSGREKPRALFQGGGLYP